MRINGNDLDMGLHLIIVFAGLLVIALAGCGPLGATPPPDESIVDARLGALETQVALQGTQVASLREHESYFATLVWDLAGRVPTRTPRTITATPYETPTPTSTPEPGAEAGGREYFPAPDGQRVAVVEDGTRLLVSDAESERELFVAEQIAGVSWFPDGVHLAMGRIMDKESKQDFESQLWVIDVRDGHASFLREGYQPVVSPEGSGISFLAGIPSASACQVGYELGIVTLDKNRNAVRSILQDEFDGLPSSEGTDSFYPSPIYGIPISGRWLDSQQVVAAFRWSCSHGSDEDGIYLLNVETRQAHKILSFPAPGGITGSSEAGQPAPLDVIHMTDAAAGWALGGSADQPGLVFRTQDGGRTWRDVTPPISDTAIPPGDGPAKAFFLDSQHAWMALVRSTADQKRLLYVWRTSDGGNTWALSPLTCASGTCPLLQPIGLIFTSPERGWLMLAIDSAMSHTYIELHRTSDGGAGWQTLIVPPGDENSGNLHVHSQTGMDFYGQDTGLVTFSRGPQEAVIVDWTADGGATWESQHLPAPQGCPSPGCFNGLICQSYDPEVLSENQAVLAVECLSDPANPSQSDGYLYTTEDRGASWHMYAFPGGDVSFLNKQFGWALTGELFRTVDGGAAWVKMADLGWADQVDFVTPALGWALGDADGDRRLSMSSDGGTTWSALDARLGP
jgi:photosystem II stability/assembly factor-like uncharacterized protein